MKQEHTINATESILLFPEGAITGTELDQIESQVDSAIPKSVLAKYARNEAIPHLLRAFEDHARIYLPQIIAKNPIEYVFGLKLAQDSMEFAMNWIFRFSKPNSPRPNFDPNHDGYLEFSEIRRQAEEYSRVFDFLSLVRRGWAQAKKGPDGTIRLATTSPGIDAHEVFETMTHFGVDQIALPPTRCSVL